MKNYQRFCKLFFSFPQLCIAFTLGFLLACTSSEKKAVEAPPATAIESEVSLNEDRTKLDKLRKEVPEDVKRDNDELAGLLALFHRKDGGSDQRAESRRF